MTVWRMKRFRLFLLAVVIGISCLFLLYRHVTGFNRQPASLDVYPSAEDMGVSLMCMDADDPDQPMDFEAVLDNDSIPLFHPPLRTQGRYIVDGKGDRIKLISINWYGASDVDSVPGGLDIRHRGDIARTLRMMGFNTVRLPYSDEMVRTNPVISRHTLRANQDLFTVQEVSDLRSLEDSHGGQEHDEVRALDVFHAVVESLTSEGLGVIVNNHITQSRWCCDGNLCDASWSNDYLGNICRVKQTEEDWIDNWQTIMQPHIHNPLVIGADLRNEVRSPLGKLAWVPWVMAAERVSNVLLSMQPDWLMFIEGVGSSNFLQGVRNRPVLLPIPDRVVYSVHIYGWSGWGSIFKGPYWTRPYDSFASDMYDNWAWLLEQDAAPVWVGEIGSPEHPNTGDLHYWTNLVQFLGETDVDWAYWAINPRKPGGDHTPTNETYSILHDDWATPKCDYRLHDLAMLGLGGSLGGDDES